MTQPASTTHDIASTQARTPADTVGRGVLIASAWLAGGAFYLAAGIVHIDDGWRYNTAAGLWIAGDLLILAGLAGLLRLRPHGESVFGFVALMAAIAARLALAGGEITSIVQANDDNILFPIGVMSTVAALIAYGVIVVRKRRWTGPSRFAPLAMGVYPVVAMMPVAVATGEPHSLLIAGWGIPAVLVGLACLRHG